jgi:hypothetical protein
MAIWLKTRRALWIPASIAAACGLLLAAGQMTVTMPIFEALSGVRVPLALLTPVIALLMLALALAGGDPQLEAVAARSVTLLDHFLAIVTASATAAVYSTIELFGLSPLGAGAARNMIGLTGLMLLGRSFGIRVGATVPVVFLLFVAALGSDGAGVPDWWAWPVASSDNLLSWLLAALLMVVGTVASWWRARTLAMAGTAL